MFTIMFTMNRGIDYCLCLSSIHLSSLYTKTKFTRKNLSRTIVLTGCKQTPITSVSLGLLQRNKYFQTPLEQANKEMSRFLLLAHSFTEKTAFKNFTEFFSIYSKFSPIAFNAVQWKFRLARLCLFFADPVTILTYSLVCPTTQTGLNSQ